MKSPVLFMIFKREDTTRRVFNRIRETRPPRLYIAADGPRKNRPDEIEKCAATRKIVEVIDWPCEVHRLYRDNNLGCGKGVSSAISWFFENEEKGIIIEDDILPHIDFFEYCDELLEKYKDDDNIQLITGRSELLRAHQSEFSYYFSNLFHIWGWASWRRVWEGYQYDATKISTDDFIKKLEQKCLPKYVRRFWVKKLFTMQTAPIDTWDYQLYFNQVLNNRYSIVPYINQIENIGFDSDDATHTKTKNDREGDMKANSALPLTHPSGILLDSYADKLFAKGFGFVRQNFIRRMFDIIESQIRKIIGT